MIASPLFIDVHTSKLKLYFFILLHILAAISILIINNLGELEVVIKSFFVLFIFISFKRCLSQQKNNIQLNLKADDLVDLKVDDNEYHDLRLSNESYVSNYFLQLILLDSNTAISHVVTIFPDSVNAITHSLLRARLKISSNCTDAISD